MFTVGHYRNGICPASKEKNQPHSVKLAKAKPAATPEVEVGEGPKKSDGTLDKRFTANKMRKGKLKKDGTADMRFKENKKKKG